MPWDIRDKTVLVTGATNGIGLAAATSFARDGADVLLVGRTQAKADAAAAAILREAGGRVEALACDFASLDQIRALTETVKARRDRLHVLLNNAGAIIGERKLSKDGLELTFAVNHLGYFALTLPLMPLLRAAAPARVINVASNAHFDAKDGLDFNDLGFERRPYKPFHVYGSSKLANIYFTFELARRLEGGGVTANCLHPGVVATGFGTTGTPLFQWLVKIGKPFLISAEKGADTAVYLATSPEVENVSGKYFYKRKAARTSKVSLDVNACRRLWDVSEALTGLKWS